MFALLLQRAALLIGADYRPRDCTQPMQSWKSYISQASVLGVGTSNMYCNFGDNVLLNDLSLKYNNALIHLLFNFTVYMW